MLKSVSLDGALSFAVVVVVIDMDGCCMNGCCELPVRSDAVTRNQREIFRNFRDPYSVIHKIWERFESPSAY